MDISEAIWDFIQRNLRVILPIFIPIGFMLADVFFKVVNGKTDFDELGADTCLAGCSLFIGTTLGQIFLKKMTDPEEIVTAVIFGFVFVSIWGTCISLSFKKMPLINSNYQPKVGFILGAATFYLCCLYTWRLLQ